MAKDRILVQATSGGYYNGFRVAGDQFYIDGEKGKDGKVAALSDRWMTTEVDKAKKVADGTNDEQAAEVEELKAQLEAEKAKNAGLEKAPSEASDTETKEPTSDGTKDPSGDGSNSGSSQGKPSPSTK